MFGRTVGNLNVLVSESDGSEKTVWSRAGNQGSEWKQATIPLTTSADTKVYFSYTCIRI